MVTATDVIAAYDRLTDGRRRFLRIDELCALGGAGVSSSASLASVDLEAEAKPCSARQARPRAPAGRVPRPGAWPIPPRARTSATPCFCRTRNLLPSSRNSRKRETSSSTARALQRQGKAAVLTMSNPRFLNAEDETTLDGHGDRGRPRAARPEDRGLRAARRRRSTHPKYAGKRLFGAGINLTHLYQGKIRYLWYLDPRPRLRQQVLPRPGVAGCARRK